MFSSCSPYAAANSEFSCETYDVEGAEQIPDNCLIWRIHTDGPTTLPVPRLSIGDPTIPGTSHCCRVNDGSRDNNGKCSTETLTYLGEKGNKSGKWGAVLPYGDIMGISVCNDTTGQYAHSSNDEQIETGGAMCWCKIVSPNGSLWVLNHLYSSSEICANLCAFHCGHDLSTDAVFRSGILGSVIN